MLCRKRMADFCERLVTVNKSPWFLIARHETFYHFREETMSKPMTPEERYNEWVSGCPNRSCRENKLSFIQHLTDYAFQAAYQARREECAECAKIASAAVPKAGYVNASATWVVNYIRARIAPPQPVWCEHIYWTKSPTHENGIWTYFNHEVSHSWDICPVAGCHKPRPVEQP